MSVTTLSAVSPEAYTHSPKLHPNLFLSSLQLLSWFLLHPSAWRNHLMGASPSLNPNFTVTELSREQWRDPAIRRLLIVVYVAAPLITGALAGLIQLILWANRETTFSNMLWAVCFCLITSLVVGVIVSVPAGVIGGVIGSLAGMFIAAIVWDFIGDGFTESVLTRYQYSIEHVIRDLCAIGVIGLTVIRGEGDSSSGAINKLRFTLVMLIAVVVIGALAFLSVNLYEIDGSAYLGFNAVLSIVPVLALIIRGKWRKQQWRFIVAVGIFFCAAHFTTAYIDLSWIARYVIPIFSPEIQPRLETFAPDVIDSVIWGLSDAMRIGVLFIILYVIVERASNARVGAIASIIINSALLLNLGLMMVGWKASQSFMEISWSVPLLTLGVILGATFSLWASAGLYPFYTLWNLLLYRADLRRPAGRPSMFRWHSVFWDETQRLPLIGLAEQLVLVAERNPDEARTAIEYLAGGSQSRAVQSAQIQLDARRLEDCKDLKAIGEIHRALAVCELEDPAGELLRSLRSVSQDVSEALRQQSNDGQRLALSAVENRLDGLLRELERSKKLYDYRFRPLVAQWRQIVAEKVMEPAMTVEQRQEIDGPAP